MTLPVSSKTAVIIGGGPAGLMAAEQLTNAGIAVNLYDAMPSVGRKFLRAGVGGLNLTHSEAFPAFVQRFDNRAQTIEKWLQQFDADDLRQWALALGIDTFVGSSGRVFPQQKKAAPLLRAWLQRLKANGLTIYPRHRFCGWDDAHNILIASPDQTLRLQADYLIFAMGGASWSRFGSDGKWQPLFRAQGIHCAEFEPSNCGFNYPWSAAFSEQHAGSPLKGVALTLAPERAAPWYKRGDAVLSRYGVEGSLVYAASLQIRRSITETGSCTIYWDLLPDKSVQQLAQALAKRKPKDSVANVLRKQLGLSGAKLALFKALTDKAQMQDLQTLPGLIKKLPQRLTQPRPLDEAISTNGGVCFSQLDDDLMLQKMSGVYCIGEMLDWETVTGGYLLTACFASGVVAGRAIVKKHRHALCK